jgi:hypothetical protein
MAKQEVSSGWLLVPATMLALLIGELLVVSLRWRFPIDTWKLAGSAALGVLVSHGLVFIGIVGMIDPSTEWTEDVVERERVEIDGKAATITHRSERKAPMGRLRATGYLLGGAAIYVFMAIMIVSYARRPKETTAHPKTATSKPTPSVPTAPAPSPAAPSPAVATPSPAAEDPATRIVALATWADAIAMAKPEMQDTTDKISPGAKLLATYAAAKSLKWSEVDVKPQTSYGRVMKDADQERGKPLCETGTLREITKQDLNGQKVYVGMMDSTAHEPVGFIAVRSTGELVAKSRGKLCGVVVGKYDFATTDNSVGHAAFLVGLFDLPENR